MVAVMASGEVVSLTAGMAIVAGVAEGFKMVSGTATESKVKKTIKLRNHKLCVSPPEGGDWIQQFTYLLTHPWIPQMLYVLQKHK